jgi:hypothetical protein
MRLTWGKMHMRFCLKGVTDPLQTANRDPGSGRTVCYFAVELLLIRKRKSQQHPPCKMHWVRVSSTSGLAISATTWKFPSHIKTTPSSGSPICWKNSANLQRVILNWAHGVRPYRSMMYQGLSGSYQRGPTFKNDFNLACQACAWHARRSISTARH